MSYDKKVGISWVYQLPCMQHQGLFHVGSHFVYMHFLRIPNFQSSIEHYVIKRALENCGEHISTICNAIEGNSIVFPLTGQKISAAFTDCRAYWRALGSVLYIGHDRCGHLSFEAKNHAFKHACCYSCNGWCCDASLSSSMKPRLCKSNNLVNAL